jgi:hypothetical protein
VGLRAEFSSGMLRAVAWLCVERMTTTSFTVRDRSGLFGSCGHRLNGATTRLGNSCSQRRSCGGVLTDELAVSWVRCAVVQRVSNAGKRMRAWPAEALTMHELARW